MWAVRACGARGEGMGERAEHGGAESSGAERERESGAWRSGEQQSGDPASPMVLRCIGGEW